MVRAAAELALSCLPHAHALNPQEIQRALLQCKEQSSDMLQRACLSVENTAKEGGVCPEVLFEVAKRFDFSLSRTIQLKFPQSAFDFAQKAIFAGNSLDTVSAA